MRYLRTNTATRITVGPFLDKTDGITPEVALTVTSEKLTLMVDAAGVPTLVIDAAPTTSTGSNDMAHVTGDDAGFYDLELAAADVNYLGRAMLALTDAATHCPVFHEFMILPAMVYDSLILGTDLLDVENSAGVATMVADYARRTGDYATAGAAMDLVDAPNATAVTAIQNGLSKPATAQTITANQAVNVAQWGGAAIATPAIAGEPVVTLDATQAAYAPAKAGDKMDIADAPSATGVGVIVAAIWDKLLTGISAVGSIGLLLKTDIDAAITTRTKPADSQIADVRKVNNVTVTGDGNATPWGPA